MRRVLITSSNCVPCKIIKNQLKSSYEALTTVEVYDIEDEEAQHFLDKHPIRGVPALIVDDTLYMGLDDILEILNLD